MKTYLPSHVTVVALLVFSLSLWFYDDWMSWSGEGGGVSKLFWWVTERSRVTSILLVFWAGILIGHLFLPGNPCRPRSHDTHPYWEPPLASLMGRRPVASEDWNADQRHQTENRMGRRRRLNFPIPLRSHRQQSSSPSSPRTISTLIQHK